MDTNLRVALALKAELENQNIEIKVEGENLKLKLPSGDLDPDLRSAITTHKQSLLDLLKNTRAKSVSAPQLFLNLPIEVARLSLRPAAKLVYGALKFHCRHKDVCRVRWAVLQAETGLSRASVGRALADLRREGFVGNLRTGRSSYYVLYPPTAPEPTTAPAVQDKGTPPNYPNRQPRNEPIELYLAGSFRWPWLLQAGRSGACFVAVKLLQLATMRKSDQVQFSSTQTAKELGMSRQTLYRQLEALEAAGLVQVDRRPGRWPVVQLLGSPRNKPHIPSKVRTAVIQRAGKKCENCGINKVKLELHHLTYYRQVDGAPLPIYGYETPNDLLALCRNCHHSKHRDINGDFWRDPEEMENYWESYWSEIQNE